MGHLGNGPRLVLARRGLELPGPRQPGGGGELLGDGVDLADPGAEGRGRIAPLHRARDGEEGRPRRRRCDARP
jgi:hypothetical protein